MINIEDVKAVLAVLGSYSEEEMANAEPVICNAVSVVSGLADEEHHSDSRLIYLAGARANYELSLIRACDGVTSFSAGDVRITQSQTESSTARAILDEAMKNASELICDKGFAFLGV